MDYFCLLYVSSYLAITEFNCSYKNLRMGREQFYWVFPSSSEDYLASKFWHFCSNRKNVHKTVKTTENNQERRFENVGRRGNVIKTVSNVDTKRAMHACDEKSKKPFQKKIRHTQISWPVLFITMSRLINYKTGQLIRAEGTESTHLKPIIGPGSEFHDTRLFVEGKVFDVNLTGRLVNCRWFPFHQTVPPEGGLGGEGHLKVSIGTEMFQAKGRIVKRKNMAQRNSIILTFCFKIKLRLMFH